MMTEPTLTDTEKARLWLRAWHGLHRLDTRSPVAKGMVEFLLAGLPERYSAETVSQWLQQATPSSSTRVIPFPGRTRRMQAVTEFFRMAADSGDERYPLPENTLESADGRFWLTVRAAGDALELTVQAVGMAIDDFAGQTIGLAAADEPSTPLIVLQLDQQSEGQIRVADTPELRKGLLHPVVGLIESGDP
jgi:hypothetical protein